MNIWFWTFLNKKKCLSTYVYKKITYLKILKIEVSQQSTLITYKVECSR